MPSEEPKQDYISLIVKEDESGERLDSFVMDNTPGWVSRNLIQSAIKEKKISVDDKIKKQSYKVKSGEVIILEIPQKPKVEILPEPIPLDIIYEDESIIVLNKSANMIVHPVPHRSNGTLVNALLYHFTNFREWEEIERPGIVHRLDKDTSGVMIVAKTQRALKNLGDQFRDRKNKKEYITIVEGSLKNDRGQVEKPLARNIKNRIKMAIDYSGKYALSNYSVIKRFADMATMALVEIKTGRTHQIRVHMKSLGTPVLGDEVYAFKDSKANIYDCPRQMLHALRLGINHPKTGEWMVFTARLPDDFKKVIRTLSSLCESSE